MDSPFRVAAACPMGTKTNLGPEGPKTLQGPQKSLGGLAQEDPRSNKTTVCGEPLWGNPSGALAPEELSPSPTNEEAQERDLACPLHKKETQFLLWVLETLQAPTWGPLCFVTQ